MVKWIWCKSRERGKRLKVEQNKQRFLAKFETCWREENNTCLITMQVEKNANRTQTVGGFWEVYNMQEKIIVVSMSCLHLNSSNSILTSYCSSGVLAKCWMCPRIVKDRELCTETPSFCVRAQFKQKGLTRSVQLNKTNDGKWVLNYIVFLLLHHKMGIQYFSSEHRDNGHIWQSQSLTAKNNIWHPIYCAILERLHQNGCARWSTSLLTANSKLCSPKMAFLWKFCSESLQQMLPKL